MFKKENSIPLEKVKSEIDQKSQKIALLNQFNRPNDMNLILKKYLEAYGWHSYKCILKIMVVLVNKKQERIISIVDLRP